MGISKNNVQLLKSTQPPLLANMGADPGTEFLSDAIRRTARRTGLFLAVVQTIGNCPLLPAYPAFESLAASEASLHCALKASRRCKNFQLLPILSPPRLLYHSWLTQTQTHLNSNLTFQATRCLECFVQKVFADFRT